MVCYTPLTAYRTEEFGSSGKRGITFQRNASLSAVPLDIPCGQCVGCRLERSRQWAIRCMHENMMHDESSFITLTYDDANLPPDGSLVKKELSACMKRLHNRLLDRRGYGIRYYGCGEYGETYGRPHYHAIVFGYGFPDKSFFQKNKRGERLFTSDELRSLWPLGHNSIGAVTFDSAAYVARYIMKKVTGDVAESYYEGRVPEFTVMSRRPGIGASYYERYGASAYEHDFVVVNGERMRPPRYYDTLFELVDSARLDKLKKKRKLRAILRARKEPYMRGRDLARWKFAVAKLNQAVRDV